MEGTAATTTVRVAAAASSSQQLQKHSTTTQAHNTQMSNVNTTSMLPTAMHDGPLSPLQSILHWTSHNRLLEVQDTHIV
jgi:hypothetical protein